MASERGGVAEVASRSDLAMSAPGGAPAAAGDASGAATSNLSSADAARVLGIMLGGDGGDGGEDAARQLVSELHRGCQGLG